MRTFGATLPYVSDHFTNTGSINVDPDPSIELDAKVQQTELSWTAMTTVRSVRIRHIVFICPRTAPLQYDNSSPLLHSRSESVISLVNRENYILTSMPCFLELPRQWLST
jgi:hypothetical protein